MNTYKLTIGPLTRELPIIPVSDSLSIASFVILGDTEVVTVTAPMLVNKLPKVDYLITAEAKGIPLVHEMAKHLNMPRYIVARKSIKAYMDAPFISKVNSITTQKEQFLCLDRWDAELIKGKRVALVDDVISSGESLRALAELVKSAGATIVAQAAILAEGDAANRDDITFLETLPLFELTHC